MLGETSDLLEALPAVGVSGVEVPAREPVPERYRFAHAEGGVAEGPPAAVEAQPELVAEKGGGSSPRSGAGRALSLGLHDLEVLVLDDPVVVHRHRDERHIAPRLRIEGPDGVIQQAEAGSPQPPVIGKAALDEERLRDSGAGRGLDVGGEDSPVERIAGSSSDEEAAERAEQPFKRPVPRPFAHRERKDGPVGERSGGDHVVEIAAVIEDKDRR